MAFVPLLIDIFCRQLALADRAKFISFLVAGILYVAIMVFQVVGALGADFPLQDYKVPPRPKTIMVCSDVAYPAIGLAVTYFVHFWV